QLEAEAFLRAEVLVRLRGVHADSDDDGVGRLVLRQVALEVMGFERAAGGEVLRIEVQNDPLPAKVLELRGLAFLAGQRERRTRRADSRNREGAQPCGREDGGGENEKLSSHSSLLFVRNPLPARENTPESGAFSGGPSFA